MFKAVHVATIEQLVHVSRYIHLNPVTAYLINIDDLPAYRWSSLRSYITGEEDPLVNTELILSQFPSKDAYRDFVFDQADYQRQLADAKHLFIE